MKAAMFGGTHQDQSQQPQLEPPQKNQAQAPTTTISAEEEALKRNTDCVYFLASPLTCKKGSDCEYRHSDAARVNPRDCWFWLNGNCLNPNCAFRHPPLDGLLGNQATTPTGHSLPPSQAVLAPAAQPPYVPGKQAVPCIFFQKGYCLKGDKCPFMHAPYSINNKIAQSAATPVTESLPSKKTFGSLEKCTQEQEVSQINVPKSVDLPPPAKPVSGVEMAPLRNGLAHNKKVPMPTDFDDELPNYRRANVRSASNENSVSRSNRNQQVHVPDDQSMPNSKDADEFSREPSPGFDVLVDDELRASDYYPNEDQFGQTRGHEGRNMNPLNDYDIDRSADYSSMADVDRDMYRDSRNYESVERLQGHYGWEEHRASSERMLRESAHLERRRYPRADSPDRIDESDLRHHLSKQKRSNGLRSVISRDHARENHADDRSYRPRRDRLLAHENLVSSRLQGRIKIPARSMSPINKTDSWSEREIDRGRHRARLSPERPQGRLRDRIKGRVQEDFNKEERNYRGPRILRDIVDGNNSRFSGPKSLAELKVGKTSETYEQHMNDRSSLGKRKYPKLEGVQQVEGDMSFEGPKPLSEILKRKRGGEVVNESGMSSANNEKCNHKERKECLMMPIESKETKGVFSSVSDDEANRVHRNKEESMHAAGEGKSSLQRNVSELEIEEGMIGGDEAIEDHEPEAYDQRKGDFDYEQADGEDYNLDEGEHADPEDEYFDEDDDADDFAKKMGVMYS